MQSAIKLSYDSDLLSDLRVFALILNLKQADIYKSLKEAHLPYSSGDLFKRRLRMHLEMHIIFENIVILFENYKHCLKKFKQCIAVSHAHTILNHWCLSTRFQQLFGNLVLLDVARPTTQLIKIIEIM